MGIPTQRGGRAGGAGRRTDTLWLLREDKWTAFPSKNLVGADLATFLTSHCFFFFSKWKLLKSSLVSSVTPMIITILGNPLNVPLWPHCCSNLINSNQFQLLKVQEGWGQGQGLCPSGSPGFPTDVLHSKAAVSTPSYSWTACKQT